MNKTVTFKGKPVTLGGHFPSIGSPVPDFSLVKNDLSEYSLKECSGRYLILNIFPSLDTGTCATTVRRFNRMAAELRDTVVLCISNDLPFAQNRFCVTEGIENVITLSAFRSDFGEQYGVLMTDGPLKGLLARAVIILNPEGKVIYTELVSEVSKEPDYEKTLKAVL